MKYFIFILSLLSLASCGTRKLTASFTTPGTPVEYHVTQLASPTIAQPAPVLLASTSNTPKLEVKPSAHISDFKKVYLNLSTQKKREFRHELKKELKTYLKNKKSNVGIQSTKSEGSGIDHDLKMALIFGIVGVIALIIPGEVFVIIGSILLIVGLIFLIKWLINL